ncbi:MAG: hypothetical protein GY810_10770 [Aureispira sp.]|nr:hypothetical protein [Aureispira sp.]
MAQQPVAFHIGEKDGFPNSEIYDMIHTPDGFLWLGTNRGLFRYDGQEFKHYPVQSASPAKTHFALDKMGRIWCMNFSNQIFYLENDTLKEFTPLRSHKINRLKNFDFDHKRNLLWLATAKGVLKYNLNTEKWSNYHSKQVIQGVASNHDMVITCNSQRYALYDSVLDSFVFANFSFPQTSTYLSYLNNKIFSSTQQNVPLPNTSGISVWQQDKFTPLLLPNLDELQNSSNMFWIQDANKNYWLLTNNGALGYTPDLKNVLLDGKRLLPGKIITELLLDKEGIYWISTLQSGLYQIPSFEVFLQDEKNSSLLDNRLTAIKSISTDQLLLADKAGNISYWDTKNKALVNNIKVTASFSQNIYHFWQTPNQQDIYFSYIKLVNNQDLEEGYPPAKSTTIINNHAVIGNNFSTQLVNLLPNLGKSPPTFNYGKAATSSTFFISTLLRRQRTRTVLSDHSKQHFWVGYSDDLYCYTLEDTSFHIIKNNKEKTSIIATDLKQSTDGLLWVSTTENGVLGIKDSTVLFHYTINNGLSSNTCTKLLIDETQKIWALSDNGINKIDYNTDQIELFDKKDGLHNYNLQDFVFHQDQVYVITSKGMINFPKDISFTNTVAPSIFLNSVAINNQDTSISEHYSLAYDQNNIKISFKALAYRSQGDFQFKYRMLGIDTTWQFTGNNNINFPALNSGEYTFEVKALNEDGVESLEQIRINFIIRPPFWKTLWFNAAILLILILIIRQVYKYRLRNITKQHQLEQDRNKIALEKSDVERQFRSSQLAALKAQMNPHFIFNALNSIQEYILLNEKRLANEYLGKFADLMRLTLDMSNQDTVILDDELKALNLYLDLEAVRFEDTFEYTIDLDPQLQNSHIQLPSMLIQPYIENAIKHGLLHKVIDRKLSIQFEFKEAEQLLICTILDNGIGRKASMEINKRKPKNHKSFAMSANQKRLELLNHARTHVIGIEIKDLYDENKVAAGTEVILNIPIELF